MHRRRSDFAIAAGNGTIYALGGSSGTRVRCSVESYPARQHFACWRLDDIVMKTRRSRPKAAVVNDKLYVLGGDERNTVAVKDLGLRSQEWIEISNLPHKLWCFDVVPFGRSLYVVGTRFVGGEPAKVEVFDTESRVWESFVAPSGESFQSVSTVIQKEYSCL